MRANEHFLRAVLLSVVLASLDPRGHPLDGERGPGQGMGEKRLIEEGRVLLEDLLLLRVCQVFIWLLMLL